MDENILFNVLNKALAATKFGGTRIKSLTARYYESLGEVNHARAIVDEILAASPNNIKFNVIQARFLIKSGEVTKAQQLLLRAEQFDQYGLYRKKLAKLRAN